MRLITLALCLALQACGGGGGGADPLPPCTIEIDADSVMSTAAHPEPASAALQRARPGWVIEDRAVTGLTLRSLVQGYAQAYPTAPVFNPARLPFAQASHAAQVVVIELGGNDAYESRDPAVFEAELIAAVTYLQAAHKVPVLTGIVQVEAWGAFDDAAGQRIAVLDAITQKVAATHGIRHAGWHDVPPQTIDGVHPTAERLGALLDRLVAAIDLATSGVCK